MSVSLIFMMSAVINDHCLHPLLNFISDYKMVIWKLYYFKIYFRWNTFIKRYFPHHLLGYFQVYLAQKR